MHRYSQGKWNALNTTKTGEDDQYIYYEAKTPGFSPFAITSGKIETIEGEHESALLHKIAGLP